jgi:hypothetical protein
MAIASPANTGRRMAICAQAKMVTGGSLVDEAFLARDCELG